MAPVSSTINSAGNCACAARPPPDQRYSLHGGAWHGGRDTFCPDLIGELGFPVELTYDQS